MGVKRIGQGLCWLLLAGMVLCWRPLLAGLPVDSRGIAAQSYEGWAGVLRVWVCGGWQPGYGSFIPWLNQQAARFEKRHPGVYLQMEPVEADVLCAFGQADPAPDGLLFAPGMLPSGQGLCPLEEPAGLRTELRGAGWWEEDTVAVAVAMGGYAWALNRTLVDQVPLDWAQLETPQPVKQTPRYLMQVPAEEPYRCWPAVLDALCAPRRVTLDGEALGQAEAQIDLGLPQDPSASPTPQPQTYLALCSLPLSLPENFLEGDDFYTGFTQGVYGAIPVTQREIRRLQLLSQSGRAPDWTVAAGGAAFTDQLLLLAVPRTNRQDGAAREALMEDFLTFLLEEDAQQALTSIRALRVTQGGPLYVGDQGMEELEQSTLGVLRPVPAFDTQYRAQGRAQAQRLVAAARAAAASLTDSP